MNSLRAVSGIPTRLARDLVYVGALAAFGVAILSSAASSQMTPNNPAVKAAINTCKDDRAKFCASVSPGGGRIAKCLIEHSDALTPACRAALIEARSASASAPN